MERETFIFFGGWSNAIAELPDKMRLEIYEAIIKYGTTGEQPELSPMAKLAFNFIREDIDRSLDRYNDICTKRKDAIEKRWKKGGDNSKQKNTENTNVSFVSNENTNDTNVSFVSAENTKHTNVSFVSNENTNDTNVSYNKNKNKNEYENKNENKNECNSSTDVEHDTQDIDIASSLHSEALSFPASAETDAAEKGFSKNFMNFFNQEVKTAGSVIKPIQSMTEKRKQALNARLREYGKPKLAIAIQKAARSDFLNGRNDRAFIATFDWILKPNNFPKVLEGNYDNSQNAGYDKQQSERDKRLEADANIMRTWLES